MAAAGSAVGRIGPMFGINGFEMVVIILVALFVIGPKRLPEYAAKLRDLVRSFRRMAEGAKTTVREDFGADLDEYDWRSLDPRQYDPRRIVREALAEEDRAIREERVREERSRAGRGGAGAPTGSDAAASAAAAAATTLTPLERHREQVQRRQDGHGAPFDPEAT